MNVLIVYARPEPATFNGAMQDLIVESLPAQGYSVEVCDLGRHSLATRFVLARKQTVAMENFSIAADIVAEPANLTWADPATFQFPIRWLGMPAILNGGADRVFAGGFAYLPSHKYDSGMFNGKHAPVATTTGISADARAPDGVDGDMPTLLWPIHNGLLRYTGQDVLTRCVACMPSREDDATRAKQLVGYRGRLETITETPHLFFHPAEDYGANERLKPGILARSRERRNV